MSKINLTQPLPAGTYSLAEGQLTLDADAAAGSYTLADFVPPVAQFTVTVAAGYVVTVQDTSTGTVPTDEVIFAWSFGKPTECPIGGSVSCVYPNASQRMITQTILRADGTQMVCKQAVYPNKITPPAGGTTPVSPPPPPPVSSPPRGSTGAVHLTGTLADGTSLNLSLDDGERVRMKSGTLLGSAYCIDGCGFLENGYAGLAGDLTGNFNLQANGQQLFNGPLTIWAYARAPFWITPPTLLANPDTSLFSRYGMHSPTASMYEAWQASARGPMDVGCTTQGIGNEGERAALGPLPQWIVNYFNNPTAENLAVALDMDLRSTPWQAHVLDPNTEKMLLASDYKAASLLDVFRGKPGNPITPFKSATPLDIDQARTHATVYGAFGAAMTGRKAYMDELSHWTNYIQCLQENPQYRRTPGSEVANGAPRGKARGLTLQVYAAKLSMHRDMFDAWNIDNAAYLNEYFAAQTGIQIDHFQNSGYPNHGFAPWQQHALIYAIGHAIQCGYMQFQPAFDYLCAWLFDTQLVVPPEYSTMYNLSMADSAGVMAKDAADCLRITGTFNANVANALQFATGTPELIGALFPTEPVHSKYKAGDYAGNPWSSTGYPPQLQPALAQARDYATDQTRAQAAWAMFQSRARDPVQVYADNGKYDIVPRAA